MGKELGLCVDANLSVYSVSGMPLPAHAAMTSLIMELFAAANLAILQLELEPKAL